MYGTQTRRPGTQKKLSRKDLDSSCHRLSRVPQKYRSNKAVKDEKQQSFVLSYYNEHPDDLDMRSPEDKLNEIQQRLQDEDLEQPERQKLLTQQKQLCYFAYGEESVQMLRSEKDLGIYYNQNSRPGSAIRHLSKAHQLEETNQIEPEESMSIAVETAEAHLALRSAEKRSETMKHMTQANEALKHVIDMEIENKRLMYRRDLAQARITTTKGRFKQALEQYERATQTLEADSGSQTEEMAGLYLEIAETAEAGDCAKEAGQAYKKAYNVFLALGMEEEAKIIEQKLPAEEEEEEEEEEVAETEAEAEEEVSEKVQQKVAHEEQQIVMNVKEVIDDVVETKEEEEVYEEEEEEEEKKEAPSTSGPSLGAKLHMDVKDIVDDILEDESNEPEKQ